MADWWWSSSYGRGIAALSYHWYDQSGNLVTLDGLRTALPDVVNPGASVDRTMSIQAPSQPGTYKLVIDCIQEDVAWFGPAQGVNWPTVEADIVVGGKQKDVYFSPAAIHEYMIAGQPRTVRVTATNKGTMAWPKAVCKLGYYWVGNNGKKISQTMHRMVRHGEVVDVKPECHQGGGRRWQDDHVPGE